MAAPKIRIKLRGFDHKTLDASVQRIVDTVRRTGAQVAGPIPMPTRVRRFTVIRGPFKHKDSREQFEIRTHSRLMDIVNPNRKTTDELQALSLPSGVDIEIKILGGKR